MQTVTEDKTSTSRDNHPDESPNLKQDVNVIQNDGIASTEGDHNTTNVSDKDDSIEKASITQISAAASFFTRAGQKLPISAMPKKKRKSGHSDIPLNLSLTSNNPHRIGLSMKSLTSFCETIHHHPPPVPPTLLKLGRNSSNLASGLGKIKVILQLQSMGNERSNDGNICLTVEKRKNQVCLKDPKSNSSTSHSQRRSGTSAPKFFAMDAIFTEDDSMAEFCAFALTDIIQAVVNGSDGCLISFGTRESMRSNAMFGDDRLSTGFGIIPSAISWLFRLIHEQKERTGARFSVRISAVEVNGKEEILKDLLASLSHAPDGPGANAPSVYLRDDPISGTQLENQSELRAPTADRAAFYLDAALTARSHFQTDQQQTHKESDRSSTSEAQTGPNSISNFPLKSPDWNHSSHLFFTLHVYQYRVERSGGGSGVAGGRSRLHLIDLGNGKIPKEINSTISNESGSDKESNPSDRSSGSALSMSAMTSVILALLNGHRHNPHRGSKLAQMLREAIGSLSCRTCIVIQASPYNQNYNENLQLLQFAHKIQRSRRHRVAHRVSGMDSSSSEMNNPSDGCQNTSSEDSSSCDSFGLRRAGRLRLNMGLRLAMKRSSAFRGLSSRQPRFGDASQFSLAASSERDYTSSSEQSCDTVIYLGRHGLAEDQHENSDNQNMQSRLGRMFFSPTIETDSENSSSGRNKSRAAAQTHSSPVPSSVGVHSGSGSGGRRGSNSNSGDPCSPRGPHAKESKRSTPRTNVHAWPRAAVKNAIETLSTQKEQWVDGPKSDFHPATNQGTFTTTSNPSQEHTSNVKSLMVDKETQSEDIQTSNNDPADSFNSLDNGLEPNTASNLRSKSSTKALHPTKSKEVSAKTLDLEPENTEPRNFQSGQSLKPAPSKIMKTDPIVDYTHTTKDHPPDSSVDATLSSQCSTCAMAGSLMHQSVITSDQGEQDQPAPHLGNSQAICLDDWSSQQCSQNDHIINKSQPCEWRKFSNVGLPPEQLTTAGGRSTIQPDANYAKPFVPVSSHMDTNTPVARVKPFVKDWIQRHSGLKTSVIDSGQVKTSIQQPCYSTQKCVKHVSTNDNNLPIHLELSAPTLDRATTLGCQAQIQSTRTAINISSDTQDYNSRSLNYQLGAINPSNPTIMPPTISCISTLETGSNFARISAWIKSVSVETYVSPTMISNDTSNDIAETSNKIVHSRDSAKRSPTVRPNENRANMTDFVEKRYVNENYLKQSSIRPHVQIISTSSSNDPNSTFLTASQPSDRAHRGTGFSSNIFGRNSHPRRGRSVPPSSLRNALTSNPSDDSCFDESHHCLGSPVSPDRGNSVLPVSMSIGPLCTKEDSRTISSSLTDKLSKNSDFDAFPSRRPDGSSNPQLHKEQQLFPDRQEMKPIDEQGFQSYPDGKVVDKKNRLVGFWNSSKKPHENRTSAAIYPVDVANGTLSPINFCSPRKKCFSSDPSKKSPKGCRDTDRHLFDCASPKPSRHQRSHSICSSHESSCSVEENVSESVPGAARNAYLDSSPIEQTGDKVGAIQSAFNKISYKENRGKNGKGRLLFLMSPLFGKKKDKDTRQSVPAPTTNETTYKVQAQNLEQQKLINQNTSSIDSKRKSQKKETLIVNNRKYSTTCLNAPGTTDLRTKVGCLRRDKTASRSTSTEMPCEANEANLERSSRLVTTPQIKNSSLQSSSGHGSECSSTLISETSVPKLSKTEKTNSLRCRCKRHHQHHHHYHQQHYHSPSKCIQCSSYTKVSHRTDSNKSHSFASDTRRPADGQRSSESGASLSGCMKTEVKGCMESGRPTSDINHSIDEAHSGKSFDMAQARINIAAPAAREGVVRRGGGHTSSGYESIVRDSEASSSHTESSSCSSADGCGRTINGGQHTKHSTASHRQKSKNQETSTPTAISENHRHAQRSPTPCGTGKCEIASNRLTHMTRTSSSPNNSKPSTSKSVQTFESPQAGLVVNMPEIQSQIQTFSGQMNDNYSTTTTTGSSREVQPPTPVVSQSASSSSSTSHRSRSAPPCSEDTSEETTSSPISVRHVPPKSTETAISSLSTGLDTSVTGKSLIEQPAKIQTHQSPYLEEVQEMERQIRYEKIYDLLAQQDMLKMELMTAKDRLLIHPSTWSFDLYVAEQMDPDDPGFLEALEKETEILRKRVDACKSHIMLITCFDIQYKPGITTTLTNTTRPNQEIKSDSNYDYLRHSTD